MAARVSRCHGRRSRASCSRSARDTRDLPDGRWQPADSEGGRPEITSACPRASHRADPRRRDGADSGIARRCNRQAVHLDVDHTSLEEDGKVNDTDEDPSEFSSSDHTGHDNRQPKCRSTAKDFGASEWTMKEWKILHASGNISASDDASEDNGKPRIYTKPSRRKT
jgi:hypothetical protein